METARNPGAEEAAGCQCWECWYDERWRYRGRVITCPLHGLPFDALMTGKSPEEIEQARGINRR